MRNIRLAADKASPSESGPKLPARPIPKPTKTTSHVVVDRSSRSWRTTALSLVYPHRSNPTTTLVPSLAQLCLRILLDVFSDPVEFANELVPELPPHLRRSLMHYTAINEPLSNEKLYSLFESARHADGEIIVIGPQASLRNKIFPSYRFNSGHCSQELGPTRSVGPDKEKSWEVDDKYGDNDWSSNTCLRTLVVISSGFSMQTYLNFPPTLTRLALVDLPTSLPIHRLPGLCPLLVILDLSFNSWLGTRSAGETALERVDWLKWSCLETLGLRECNIDPAVLKRVNHKRFVDVRIIQ